MNNKLTKTFPVVAVALMALMALLPTVQAATSFGSVVGSIDFDTTYAFPTVAPAAAFRFFDDDSDTVVDLNDPVYLHLTGAGTVSSLDIRISPGSGGGLASGTQVAGIDNDAGLVLAGAALAARVADLDNSGGYTAGDAVYVNVNADNVVSAGDVRLVDSNGKLAGSRVTSADADSGTPFLAAPLGGAPDVFDLNGDAVYNRGDVIYWDTDASGTATVNDIRLMPFNGKTFGSVVGGFDFDTTYAFPTTPPAPRAFRFFDDDSDTVVDLNDPVYLHLGGALTVSSLDIRISPGSGGGLAAGTQVAGIDNDAGLVLAVAALAARVADLDNSGGYTAGDAVYVNVNADNVVSAGDVRLVDSNGKLAGSRVTSADADSGTPYLAAPLAGAPDVFDLNGDNVYNRGDIMYWDTDASSTATVNDIRLMPTTGSTGTGGGSGGSGSGGSSGSSGSNSGSAAPTPTPVPTTSHAPTTSAQPAPTTSNGPKTPGFELVALVGALGAALILVRRKL